MSLTPAETPPRNATGPDFSSPAMEERTRISAGRVPCRYRSPFGFHPTLFAVSRLADSGPVEKLVSLPKTDAPRLRMTHARGLGRVEPRPAVEPQNQVLRGQPHPSVCLCHDQRFAHDSARPADEELGAEDQRRGSRCQEKLGHLAANSPLQRKFVRQRGGVDDAFPCAEECPTPQASSREMLRMARGHEVGMAR